MKNIVFISVFILVSICSYGKALSGDFTVVDSGNNSTDTYVSIQNNTYILYQICVDNNGVVHNTTIDSGFLVRRGNGYEYSSDDGGVGGTLVLNQNQWEWNDSNGPFSGELTPNWPTTYPPCG